MHMLARNEVRCMKDPKGIALVTLNGFRSVYTIKPKSQPVNMLAVITLGTNIDISM